ncbi:MAG: pantoate--beta-alanine ligase [Methylococcaceae bacterium]
MQTLSSVHELRKAVAVLRSQGQSIAFVPTMGNLHAGHIGLVHAARALADCVVVSIFVNPAQFGPSEDFLAYPRTEDADAQQLRRAGADLLFLPGLEDMYPKAIADMSFVEVPGLSSELCGRYRPGHFRGVATVVCKLFNQVQPDVAVFGEKDYQQLLIIRRMVADLDMPIRIVGVPTVREWDGLAMSSRNIYLSEDERASASLLYENLNLAAAAMRGGRRDFVAIEYERTVDLIATGFATDYFSIRRQLDLGAPIVDDVELIVMAAVRLGRARLIDNLKVRVPVLA